MAQIKILSFFILYLFFFAKICANLCLNQVIKVHGTQCYSVVN